MRKRSLIAAVATILAANAFALVHVWRNRSGAVEAELTLTEREILRVNDPEGENSGVMLRLVWQYPEVTPPGGDLSKRWLDRERLGQLGFDVSMDPADARAMDFYRRQRARRVFAALEYDGAGWQAYVRRMRELRDRTTGQVTVFSNDEPGSKLVMIDVGTSAEQLRARHPDRRVVIVVPAVAHIMLVPGMPATPHLKGSQPHIVGSIGSVESNIHVPLPHSAAFRGLPDDVTKGRYRVQLRYGASLEPWIAGVEILK